MRSWYSDWMGQYLESFGITDDATIAAIAAWEEVLVVSLCATADELKEVTRLNQLEEATPRWATDHFDCIKRNLARVKTKAAIALTNYDEWEETHGICDLCQNAGLVIVPHPRYVKPDEGWVPYRFLADGSPLRATAGVYCRCTKGQHLFQNALRRAEERERQKPLDLDRYEQMVTSRWRDMLAYEELRKRSVAAARPERNPHPELRG